TCLDLFGPGEQILSTWNNGGTNTLQGTSMATPHVAGVAARYLQTHPLATPAQAWAAINAAANVASTPGGGGVINRMANDPNEILHWGTLNDGYTDGDPHLTTVDGIQYDFQGAGEFVLLRDGSAMEVQTRQKPVTT